MHTIGEMKKIEERLYSVFRDLLSNQDRLSLFTDGHVYPSVWRIEGNKKLYMVLSGSEIARYLGYYAELLVDHPSDIGETEVVQSLIDLCRVNDRIKDMHLKIIQG
jgi:hypothetical protein